MPIFQRPLYQAVGDYSAVLEGCRSNLHSLYETVMSHISSDAERMRRLRQLESVSFTMISLRGFSTLGLVDSSIAYSYAALMAYILLSHYRRTKARDEHYIERAGAEDHGALAVLTISQRWIFKWLAMMNIVVLSAYGACMIDAKTSPVWKGLFDTEVSRTLYFSMDIFLSFYAYYHIERYDYQRVQIKRLAVERWVKDFFQDHLTPTSLKPHPYVSDLLQQQFSPLVNARLLSISRYVYLVLSITMSLAVLMTDILGAYSILPNDMKEPLCALLLVLGVSVVGVTSFFVLRDTLLFRHTSNTRLEDIITQSQLARSSYHRGQCFDYLWRCIQPSRRVLSPLTLRALVESLQLADALLCARTDKQSFQIITGNHNDQQSEDLLLFCVIGLPLMKFFIMSTCQFIETHSAMKESMVIASSPYLAVDALFNRLQQPRLPKLSRDEKNNVYRMVCEHIASCSSREELSDRSIVGLSDDLSGGITTCLLDNLDSAINWQDVQETFNPEDGYAQRYLESHDFIDDQAAYQSITSAVKAVVDLIDQSAHDNVEDVEALMTDTSSDLIRICDAIKNSDSVKTVQSYLSGDDVIYQTLINTLDEHALFDEVKAAFDISNPQSVVSIIFQRSLLQPEPPAPQTLFAQVSQYVADQVQAWTAVFLKH
tara:strand:- start:6437 stop:8407 length:1971 start_codon:yes stop_codon:yes gene_type:complete